MPGKAPRDLLTVRPKRWSVGVRNHIKDRQQVTCRFEPANGRLHIIIAAFRIDRAEQRMLEHPIKSRGRILCEKVALLERRFKRCCICFFASEKDCRWCDIEAGSAE